MNEEVKRVSQFWEEKFGSNVDSMYYENRLLEIDLTLQECDEILEEVGLGTGFISKESELKNLLEDKRTLWNYVLALPDFISSYLDEPFCKALNQHATETISVIKMEDFSVNAGEDNQIGITESYYDPYLGEYKETQTKTTFRFADFLGTGYSESANKDGWIVTKSGYVEEFARIFEAQYQGMREIAEEEFKKRGITDYETYIDSFFHQGEFDHRMDKPFLSFVSSVLDITVVKPMIESSIEKDLITGEDLSDLECQFKLVFAGVDMATLGGAMGATRLSEMGMKEALKATGKTVAVEFMGNTAVCGIGAIGQAFNWPVPVTIMLSLATGITVSCIGNKLVFEGEGFRREVPIEEVEGIRQGESGSASKIGSINEIKQSFTREDIITSLDGVTNKSTEIANAIRNKDIGINVLGDELFEKYLGCSSDTVAMQVGEQIYVRSSSVSLFSDIVHEGTHAIDYYNGIDENIIASWTGETTAYNAERLFQIESGMSVQFESEEDMMVHIWSNYSK
ncbi:pre-toxin TG domain-containing protein [Roseburia sp. MSJ-14]|uniref:pre-toxin TG domain-containing protein n=1 Tax=Roseburia sp. MSJ-14 TaxID=2841514 RepID=UPI001C0FDD09|nr:pre-toxin TG domain-containing protein [Roseburia sp. MSJ-14]MBU5473134.1 pre-toxin TG domain-containing protein [Roseburia sp. MSJ-14]